MTHSFASKINAMLRSRSERDASAATEPNAAAHTPMQDLSTAQLGSVVGGDGSDELPKGSWVMRA